MSPRVKWDMTKSREEHVKELRAMARHAAEEQHACGYVYNGSQVITSSAVVRGMIDPLTVANLSSQYVALARMNGGDGTMSPNTWAEFIDNLADAIEAAGNGTTYIGPIRGEVC